MRVDHLARAPVDMAMRSTRTVVVGEVERVIELLPGESTVLKGLRLQATPADHHGFGPPIGPTELAIGLPA